MYRNVETLLCAWLKTTLQVDEVVPELPYNAEFLLPLVAVERFGGGDDTITLDNTHVDIDVFHVDRISAMGLAEQVRYALRAVLPGKTIGDRTSGTAAVSGVQTISAPSVAPWGDARIRRVTAAYRITLHSPL